MLTGLYEFEDSMSFIADRKSISAEAGIAAEIMALFNIPVRASANAKVGNSHITRSKLVGKSVWAAQYQLLDVQYFRTRSKDRNGPLPPLTLPLQLKKIWSPGQMRDSSAKHEDPTKRNNTTTLRLSNITSSQYQDPDENEQVFWRRLAEVEAKWNGGILIDDESDYEEAKNVELEW
ncbi:hypothetical protein MPH_07525 [Macrophomina phaseolina MS6]|uniref:Uncharacterized protein n=1 Tax=Macrophomina phaseolina (strain MS6) TaxID=1126212 RepID=K2QZ61_MACPH|nr:hypothetical protein MPH_07525 [Macrophomina phaseolina MS6]